MNGHTQGRRLVPLWHTRLGAGIDSGTSGLDDSRKIQVRGNQNDTHYLSHIIEEAKITASGGEFGNVCILKLFIFSEIIL